MNLKRVRHWTPALIAVGVLVPALVLAGMATFLTLRTASAVEEESARYNRYVSHMLAQGYEQALLEVVHRAIAPAENVARAGGDEAAIREALRVPAGEMVAPTWFTLDQLMNMTLLVVEGQPVVYTSDPRQHPGRVFAGMLLRGREGDVLGAGGWWFDQRRFLAGHLTEVVDLRMADNPRIYGGGQSMRGLSVSLLGSDQALIARVREPSHHRTAQTLWLGGPFEGFALRVAAAAGAPVSWVSGVVGFELTLIVLMLLVIASAALFALRYTTQQLILASHKASFVSNVSHELKTPLALIRLAVETLELGRVREPQERERFLRTIGRETERLAQLVDSILDFARLEAGRREFHFSPTDLGAIVTDVLDSFRARLDAQGFHTEVALPPDLPPIRADGAAISQCVINLLDNAVKYSRDRKELRVAAEARGDQVALSVGDRGVGISPREQRRIFEHFVRLDHGLVHEVKGAGLGLALVDHIVRAHGGRVEVKSVPGEGSIFTLLLPVADVAPGAGDAPPPAAAKTG
jgi:signal transduction histidine kinase